MTNATTSEINSTDIVKKLFGDKWKFLIICLLFNRSLYYGELLSLLDEISKKVLTENLRELEEMHIIQKENRRDGNVLKVLYMLTDVGRSLKPIFNNILEWSLEYSQMLRNNAK